MNALCFKKTVKKSTFNQKGRKVKNHFAKVFFNLFQEKKYNSKIASDNILLKIMEECGRETVSFLSNLNGQADKTRRQTPPSNLTVFSRKHGTKCVHFFNTISFLLTSQVKYVVTNYTNASEWVETGFKNKNTFSYWSY